MIDGVAVEDDELQRPGQLEDAFDFGLNFGYAVRSRIAALHQSPLRRVIEQGSFGQ